MQNKPATMFSHCGHHCYNEEQSIELHHSISKANLGIDSSDLTHCLLQKRLIYVSTTNNILSHIVGWGLRNECQMLFVIYIDACHTLMKSKYAPR